MIYLALNNIELIEINPLNKSFKMHVTQSHTDHYINNAFENFTTELVYAHLKENSLFIDIGAHYGYYTILAGSKYNNCKILSFEPVPFNYEILKKNIENNKLSNVEIYRFAVSDKDDNKKFFIADHSSRSGFYEPYLSTVHESMTVETVCLDNFLKNHNKEKILIKIDAEGHEIAILNGMKNIIKNSLDIEMFIEFNPEMLKISGYDPSELFLLIDILGFDIFLIDDQYRMTLKVNDYKNWKKYFGHGNYKKDHFNILCVKKENSLNVCIFSHSSLLLGAERSLLEMVKNLISDHNALCTVVLPYDGPLRLKLENIGASIIISDYDWWFNKQIKTPDEIMYIMSKNFIEISKIIPQIEKIDPDIIYTNTLAIPWGILVAYLLNKPHAWHVREFGYNNEGYNFYLPFEKVINIIKSSNYIFTNSDAVKNTLFKNYGQNIKTVYNYIEIPSNQLNDSVDRCFNIKDSLKLIIVGHITESKGQRDAIFAVKKSLDKKLNVELLIMGTNDPDYMGSLIKYVEENGLTNNIKFLDFKENPYNYIKQADVLLLCSHTEAFGRVLVEAMLLKKPVIGTNLGGTPEIIIEGVNGFLYDIGDHDKMVNNIEYFYNNRDKILEFGNNGYNLVKEKITKEKYSGEIFKQLLKIKNQKNRSNSSIEFQEFLSDILRKTVMHLIDASEKKDMTINENIKKINELNAMIVDRDAKSAPINDNINKLNMTNEIISQELSDIKKSVTWRSVQKYHKLLNIIAPQGSKRIYYYNIGVIGLRILINEGPKKFLSSVLKYIKTFRLKSITLNNYYKWILKNEPNNDDHKKIEAESKNFLYNPKISIIIPVWNTDKKWLCKAIDSVLQQSYTVWELCLVDGNSSKPYIKRILSDYTKKDNRIKVKFLSENKGISGNSNEALSMATGDFITLLDHDDEIAPFALFEIVKFLNQNPDLDYIYSDEDKIDTDDKRFEPFFKPDWSPDLLLACGYTNHLSVYRKVLVDKIGGFRIEYNGSQDYDLLLRFTENIPDDHIGHIPKILYHWRQIPGSTSIDPFAKNSLVVNVAKKALEDAIKRRGIKGKVVDGLWPSSYRVIREINGNPKISIIIPTKDKVNILKKCIDSIENKTTYKNYEIIIVDNNSNEIQTKDYLKNLKHKVIQFNEKFNFSKINNIASKEATGDYIIFLNNDIEILSPDWIESMLEQAQIPEIGAVGAKLLYPDGSIQHAGVILGMSPDQATGIAGHIFNKFSYKDNGYFGFINVIKNYSAVTAATMMVRKSVFDELGGFDEKLSVCYNDVDLCLRMRKKGYRIVYTPYSELIHHESQSRGCFVDINEAKYMVNRWGDILKHDPYYSPNLALDNYNCEIRYK